ncbi:MAG: YSIRK-type signal peptide-containing protein [Limosilactobacillus sp.]|uniref:YSIRK-type signal peptide-containing protein n=1 Tax=Limosilactobacillus sp. TaxID=2773925 RepID=UPI0025C6CFDC|nr:YSIRK-type signal peptide-containing protein [Limosilactobacillus sp.]MCI1974494.1 YSIRK-type signal peptide-containing protein [Limosilactobacillus sp.]MCI2030653.1 YSIRK-type signal peptide-containing protein [Limosilactobacillus sp.]
MSSKNTQEYLRRMEKQRQRFGLRKLSIGVASVLLGTTFIAGGTVAHADDVGSEPLADAQNKVKVDSTSEQQTFTLQNQQPATVSAINEPKVTTPADQVTATFHIYDAGYGDIDFSNGTMKELPAITISGKAGSTVAELINQRIESDTQKQLQDTKYGYGYVVDSDGQEHLVGISPVVALSDMALDIAKQQAGYTGTLNEESNFTGGLKDGADQILGKELANQTILQDMVAKGVIDKPSITEAYNKWLANKKKNYPLAGYQFDPDYNYYGSELQAGTSGDTKVTNGGDYIITLKHNNMDFKVDKRFYVEVPRTVEFKYYYDKNVPDPDRPEVEGQPPKSTIGSRVDYTKGSKKVDTVGDGNVSVSMKDANTDTSTLIDALHGSQDKNRVIYRSITDRLYDAVLGVVDKNTQEQNNNYSGVIQFPGFDVPKVDDWTTYDPAVPTSGTDFGKEGTYYYDSFGQLNNAQKNVGNPPTEYLIYYHNQPVDITFEDVTDSAKPVKLSSFDLSQEINVHDNLHYQFDKPPIPTFALKDHYKAYNYQADDNYYKAKKDNGIAVDPSGKLASTQNLDYAQVLKAYTDNGYVLVATQLPSNNSRTNYGLDYDKDGVWKKDSSTTANDGHSLITKHITVKLMRLAKQGPSDKIVTRTVHFVTNTENNPELNPVVEQKVSFHTNDSYWVDTTTGKQIDSTNVKQVTGADGQTYNVVSDINAPEKTVNWTTDNDTFDGVKRPEITKDEGELEGTWKIIKSTKDTVDGTEYTGKDAKSAPEEKKVAKDVKNGDHEDVFLIYGQQVGYNVHYRDVTNLVAKDGKTTDFTKDDGDDLGHEVHNINGIVGETPDKTADLWKTYADEGYVLVSNPSGDQLGKQELTKGVQDQYVYLMKTATKQTEPKTAERTIHYVGVVHDNDDVTKAQVLKDPTTQNVTLTGTYYVDHDGKRVNTKTVTVNGHDYDVVVEPTDDNPAKEIWKIDGKATGVSEDKGKYDFAKVDDPDKIGEGKDQWHHKPNLDQANGAVTVDPNSTDWKIDQANKLPDGYLVYKQKGNYNIHYVDVTKSVIDGKTRDFTENDGNDLGHEVTDINGYVDETPDKTDSLWTNYGNEGYVLVSNPSGDTLGKQTLTSDTPDQYVYLMKVATKQTEQKTAERTIHYVGVVHDDDDVTQAQVLQKPTTQNVTLTGTYYVDHDGKRVNTKQVKIGNQTYDVVDDRHPATETWTIDSQTGVTENNSKYDFAKVATPDEIGEGKNQWTHKADLDQDNGQTTVDPNSKDWSTNKVNKLTDGYVVYKQHAKYNIHYIDVNGVENKTTYDPTDGHELEAHLVTNVGDGEDITTPTDASKKLWSKEDYEKAGYVLVGLSENAKNDQLGKQELTLDVQDQYVYLKHAVKTITHKTPVTDVPKDKDGKPAVDPKDLYKEFSRNIYYKANTVDGKTLKDVTTQQTEFNGSIDVDVVTGKTTTAETIKVDGKNVKVATTKPGKITWDKTSATFDKITQPTITLNESDKHAEPDTIGTWYQVSGKADEVKVTPNDTKNPSDETLVYKQNNPGSDTPGSDVPGSDTPGSDTPGSDVPGSDTPGSDTPGSDTPGSDVPGSDTPGSDTPGSDTPGSDTPGSDTPGSDVPGSDTPGSDTPGSDTPGSDTPGSDVPGSDTPGSDTPGSDLPGSDTPGSDVPGSDVPGSDTPGSDTPGSDTSGSDTPGSDTPGSDTPGSDTPGSDTPGSDVPGSDTPGSDTPDSDIPGSETPIEIGNPIVPDTPVTSDKPSVSAPGKSTNYVEIDDKEFNESKLKLMSNKQQSAQLPQTGNESSRGALALGIMGLLSALGLGKLNRKRHD